MIVAERVAGFYERYTTPPLAPETNRQHLVRKLVRRVHWARTEGLGRIIEEDRLDPRQRVRTALGKARWRRAHPHAPGLAVPVYVVGLQRSGTNMLMRGLDEAPEIEVRNENDRTVFERHRIRSSEVLRQTITASRQQLVFVKPICDSHRVDELLDLHGVPAGRALWVYRDVDARARSEVSHFGSANLLALRDIAAGRGHTRWQGERLPRHTVELIRGFDLQTMDPHSAAALFWVVRNSLYFDLGFAAREDILLVSYDEFAAHPQEHMRRLCDFVGVRYRDVLCAHVDRRVSHGSGRLDIDARVRELADAMSARLDAERSAQDARLAAARASRPTATPSTNGARP